MMSEPKATVRVSQVQDNSGDVYLNLRSKHGYIAATTEIPSIHNTVLAVIGWQITRSWANPARPTGIVVTNDIDDFLNETKTEDGEYVIFWRSDEYQAQQEGRWNCPGCGESQLGLDHCIQNCHKWKE